MDAPLLALTRRRPPPPGSSPEHVASDNMRQLIQLRWIACAGQLVTIVVVHVALGVPLPVAAMLGVIALLAVVNLAETIALPRHRVTNLEFLLALLLDMGALTIQLYLSGGATNPFIPLLLVQVVLGAILLERWAVWVLVAASALAYALLAAGYRPLILPARLLGASAELYTFGNWLGFAMVGVLLVLFSTRITRNLRLRDAYLADLRQRAAEEDGIVRMGLFASGAAHELGTPLASLSVIVGDLRRIPRLMGDPDVAADLAEMEAEVTRCKRIVGDILHSAGEPRGDALASRPAGPFLDEAMAAWQETQAGTVLAYTRGDLGEAALIADPALRQALWNLLDNAAEASPGTVAVTVEREGDAIVTAVHDRGPGFGPDQLVRLGTPQTSRKGAGHGLGLFLAANVARRLGGRLEAMARPGGGATVQLRLPLIVAGRTEA